jgi:hypothetical protein
MTDKQQLQNFVDGAYLGPVDGNYSDLVDPVTGEVFAHAPISGPADVDRAMTAAATAFESWRDVTPAERQKALLKFADAVESRAAELVETSRAVFDVAYHPWPTPLVAAAERSGLESVTGLDLLVHQAALQVELMTGSGVDPELLRAAARTALAP